MAAKGLAIAAENSAAIFLDGLLQLAYSSLRRAVRKLSSPKGRSECPASLRRLRGAPAFFLAFFSAIPILLNTGWLLFQPADAGIENRHGQCHPGDHHTAKADGDRRATNSAIAPPIMPPTGISSHANP